MDFYNMPRGGRQGLGSFPSWFDDYGSGVENISPSSPFLGIPSSPFRPQPRKPPERRSVPVSNPSWSQNRAQVPEGPRVSPSPPKQEKGKVRNIVVEDGNKKVPKPNRFVRPEDAALKIQCVFRGYVIRRTKPMKHLKTIRNVAKEVARFKSQVSDPQWLKTLRENVKEQLCFTEGLMQLQERLDSIQGVLPLVREARKAANRDLCRFQEQVDAMIKGDEFTQKADVNEEVTEMATDVKEDQSKVPQADLTGSVELEPEAQEQVDGDGEKSEKEEEVEQKPQEETTDMQVNNESASEDTDDTQEKPEAQEHVDGEKSEKEEETPEAEQKLQEETSDMQVNETADQVNDESEVSEAEEPHDEEDDVVEKAVLVSEPKCEGMDIDSNCPKKRERESDSQTESGSSVEKLVKKLMDENAQLKAMVTECLKQNALRNEVLLRLNKRVQRLEKKKPKRNMKNDCLL